MYPFLKNWQGGLAYHLNDKLYLAALYKRENEKKALYSFAENRYTLESGWKTNLKKDLDFDCRLRAEIRRFNLSSQENHLRFRLRARLKTRLALGNLP